MKQNHFKTLLTALVAAIAVPAQAVHLVNDTWLDGDRTDPAAPGYSEHGVDADADGNLESAWYFGGAGSLAPVGPGGPLRGDLGAGGTSSGSWTTHFTAGGNPINLTSAGDFLRVTWQFTLSGLGVANTSQNFRMALVNTPAASLLAADGAPGNSTYAGYGMFMNMGATTLGNSNPFRLMERTAPGTSSALLSASGSWTGLANGATSGNGGYEEGVLYTYIMEVTLNGLGELEILSSMTGGTLLNNTGSASVLFTDTTPNSTSFNTFSLRPSSATGSAQIFDTSLFRVEVSQVPEPTVAALAALGVFGLIASRRIRR
jgi:hypothetical protein